MECFHEIFELSFQRQQSCPKKYVLNIEEKLGIFTGSFLISLEQRFCRTLVNSCIRDFAGYLLRGKIKASHSI